MSAPKGNQFYKNVKEQTGSPPFYNTPEELTEQVNHYFNYIKGFYEEQEFEVKAKDGSTETETKKVCVREPEPPTITGLCIYLGFESRQSFYDYAEKKEFAYAIKSAKIRIESEYEKRLHYQHCTGPIFALKNMGWVDSQAVDHTTKGEKMDITPPQIIVQNTGIPMANAEAEVDAKQPNV